MGDVDEYPMINSDAIVHPKLQHVGVLTGDLPRLLDWYHKVLGMRCIHESVNPTNAPADSPLAPLKAAFISNDEISHRFTRSSKSRVLSPIPTVQSISGCSMWPLNLG